MHYVSHSVSFVSVINEVINHRQLIIGKRLSCRTPQSSLVLTNKPLQEEVVFEEVSEQAGHSYCGPAGGYEDIAECRKNRTERQPVPAIVLGLMFNKERVHIQCHQIRRVSCVHPYLGCQAVRAQCLENK